MVGLYAWIITRNNERVGVIMMFETMFINSIYLVLTILVWSALAMALFLMLTFTWIMFTVMGEDYQYKMRKYKGVKNE
jgi:uncharacterized protein (DUF983 family)